jgi:hypothetical protein
MQRFKKTLIFILIYIILPVRVNAGSISFNNPQTTSSNKYTFTITTNDLDLNYIKGNLNITNGVISNITMANGWINKTGNNNEFYFYYDGISKGSYQVATVEVTMSDNSVYTVSNLKYGTYTCQIDSGLIFGEAGKITDSETYNNTCNLSKDATLKSLSSSVGAFTTSFNRNNYYYNLKVSSDVKVVTFNAIPSDSSAKIISGQSCDVTVNKECQIKVAAAYGNTKTYYVYIINEQTTSNEITNFKVVGGSLNTAFKTDVYEYTLTPSDNATDIYFTFDFNNQNLTSGKCSTLASNCKLTVNQKTYTFNLVKQDETTANCEDNKTTTTDNSSSSSSKTASKKTNKTNNQKTSKQTTSSTTTSKNTESNTTEAEASTSSTEEIDENIVKDEEETIDPVEYNKNKTETTDNDTLEESKVDDTIDFHKSNNKKNLIIAIIICAANIVLGLAIGIFINKHKHK